MKDIRDLINIADVYGKIINEAPPSKKANSLADLGTRKPQGTTQEPATGQTNAVRPAPGGAGQLPQGTTTSGPQNGRQGPRGGQRPQGTTTADPDAADPRGPDQRGGQSPQGTTTSGPQNGRQGPRGGQRPQGTTQEPATGQTNAVRPAPGGAGQLPQGTTQEPATGQTAADEFAGGNRQGGEFDTTPSDAQQAADEFAGGNRQGGEFDTTTVQEPATGQTTQTDEPVQEPATGQTDANTEEPQQDALAGRLDTTTPSLMDAYNDGGKQAMDSVRDLQQALERLGIDPNGVDGKYGRGTYAAVQEFQRQNGLQVDGEAGPETMAALQRAINAQAGSTAAQPQAAEPTTGPDDGTRGGQEPNRTVQEPATGQTTQTDEPVQEPATGQTSPGTGATAPGDIGDGLRGGGDDSEQTIVQEPATGQTQSQAVPVRPEEMDRFQELMDKVEQEQTSTSAAGQESGQPNAELDGQERGVQTASVDMSMKNMLALVEFMLHEAPEDLTDQEREELDALFARLEASDDPRAKELVSRYNKAFPKSDQAIDNKMDRDNAASSASADGPRTRGGKRGSEGEGNIDAQRNVLQNHNALADEIRSGSNPIVAEIEAELAKGGNIVQFNGVWMTKIRDLAREADPQRFQSLNTKLQVALAGYFNKKYNGGSDTNFRIGNTNDFYRGIQQQISGSQGATNRESWDNDMTDKSKLKEASMNISMNGTNASEIGELMRIMQLAGTGGSGEHTHMPIAPDALHTDDDSHNEMPCPVCGIAHGEEAPTPCGMGEELVGEDWDNGPSEEYKDHNYMVKDLSGGINRQKKMYAASQRGDNAMAVESVKDQLYKALEGKYANDAQRKAVHAAKNKKK